MALFLVLLLKYMTKITLEPAWKLFKEYRKIASTTANGNFIVEVDKRMQQLEFILEEVSKLHTEWYKLHKKGKADISDVRWLKLELFAETFYYIAFRLMKVFKQLPHLRKFECKEITFIRNHLIEHPEGKTSQIFTNSFGLNEHVGPMLKPARTLDEKDKFVDKGLYPNASLFIKLLTSSLDAALKKIKQLP